MNKLLGIYIPTYNRKRELKQCLDSLLPQLRKYSLPIYISDTSTDGTAEMLARIKQKYPYLFYVHSDVPSSFVTNIKRALRLGHTGYAWLLSDDDLIDPDAIATIMGELENKLGFLQINNQPYSNDMSRKIGPPSIRLYEDVVYEPGEHEKVLLTAENGYAGFMGSIITSKKDLDKELKKNKVESPDFITSILIFKSILGKRGKLIAKPLIKYRMGGKLRGRASEVWLLGYPATMEALKPEYSEKAIRKASKRSDSLIIVAINGRDFPNKRDSIKDTINRNKTLNLAEKAAAKMILRFYRPKPRT